MNIIKAVTIITSILLTVAANSALAESYSPQHDKVAAEFKGPSEKAAKDAVWTSPTTFKVGVMNNGSNRDGYAQYVCMVLNDFGFKGKGVLVRIVDYGKLVRDGSWDNLGTAHCQ
jgi:hypothetical protein